MKKFYLILPIVFAVCLFFSGCACSTSYNESLNNDSNDAEENSSSINTEDQNRDKDVSNLDISQSPKAYEEGEDPATRLNNKYPYDVSKVIKDSSTVKIQYSDLADIVAPDLGCDISRASVGYTNLYSCNGKAIYAFTACNLDSNLIIYYVVDANTGQILDKFY